MAEGRGEVEREAELILPVMCLSHNFFYTLAVWVNLGNI
jgi:hypothetical protein